MPTNTKNAKTTNLCRQRQRRRAELLRSTNNNNINFVFIINMQFPNKSRCYTMIQKALVKENRFHILPTSEQMYFDEFLSFYFRKKFKKTQKFYFFQKCSKKYFLIPYSKSLKKATHNAQIENFEKFSKTSKTSKV